MVRPSSQQPTPGELEILKVLWQVGPSSVRQVMEASDTHRPRAYTSVMSLLNVMTDKGWVTRTAEGKAFVYTANVPREKTLGELLSDVLGRAFEGSASKLVAHLLKQSDVSNDELAEISRTIQEYQQQQEDQIQQTKRTKSRRPVAPKDARGGQR
jgi:BlaI family penicillinase repressor